jgi:hypothetical protein
MLFDERPSFLWTADELLLPYTDRFVVGTTRAEVKYVCSPASDYNFDKTPERRLAATVRVVSSEAMSCLEHIHSSSEAL